MPVFLDKLLHPSINKWAALTGTGMSSTIGYGVREVWNQPIQEAKHLSFSQVPFLSGEIKAKEIIVLSAQTEPTIREAPQVNIPISPAPKTKPKKSTPYPQPTKTPEKPKPPKEEYPIDPNWLNSVNNYSMAYKYQTHLLLVTPNHKAWKTKSMRLKEMAKQEGGDKFWTYWGGYLPEKKLTPSFVYALCRTSLSYSEYGTLWSLGMSKQYMDFLWDICGRDDMPKPKNWWYSEET